MYYELAPAYGRDYATKSQVVEAFKSGKDFQGDFQLGFRLCNKDDFKPGDGILLRYKRLTQVASVKL